jgi:hypothetical protein
MPNDAPGAASFVVQRLARSFQLFDDVPRVIWVSAGVYRESRAQGWRAHYTTVEYGRYRSAAPWPIEFAFSITRQKHQETLAALEERRAAKREA